MPRIKQAPSPEKFAKEWTNETVSFISLMDRASGKVKHLGEIEIVDIPDSMEPEQWAKFFPTLDKEMSSGDDALEVLLKGAAKLNLPEE